MNRNMFIASTVLLGASVSSISPVVWAAEKTGSGKTAAQYQ